MSYRAPVGEMVFAMRHVAGLDRAIAEELHGDLSLDLVETILEVAGKFANEELAPLNRSGDLEGLAFKDGAVAMPRSSDMIVIGSPAGGTMTTVAAGTPPPS